MESLGASLPVPMLPDKSIMKLTGHITEKKHKANADNSVNNL